MSILIPNMGMPSCCNDCFAYYDGYCKAAASEDEWSKDVSYETYCEKREDYCPLIEVPPHGFIDKQMLLRNIADNQFAHPSVGHEEDYAFWGRVWDYIFDAPTIIEAEGEE